MAIDIRQFHQTFFDESLEGLASTEETLLRLEHNPESADAEVLNAIFRVVHSIKGGSGTFGFGWLTDFSHLLEGLLDDLRDGRRALDKNIVVLLLRAVDSLRNLMDAARTDCPVNKLAIETVTSDIEKLRAGAVRAPVKLRETNDEAAGGNGWRIVFRPKPEIFHTGNDPLRYVRELARLGVVSIACHLDQLPSWRSMDPERCHLGWTIELHGKTTRAAIDEVFTWVADVAALDITPLGAGHDDESQRAVAGTDGGRALIKMRGTSLRVSTHKVDALLDVVGELVITQTILQQTAAGFTPNDLPRLLVALSQLERNVRELQESVMSIRLLPLGFLFGRLPRLVRDIGESLGKSVRLQVRGEQTELDKTMIERISDPILHMVRNAIDHGIEPAAERRVAGKSETGTIRIEAQQKGGNVIIEVEDDGRGLAYDRIAERAVAQGHMAAGARLTPEQLCELIFLPGMTTSDTVTDISGRGVGLDVVRNHVRGLGGNVDVSSRTGQGTRFTIRLPLTLAILDGLGIEVGDQTYILPLVAITESVRLGSEDLQHLPGGGEIFALRNDYLPLVRLHEVFGIAPRVQDVSNGTVVIIEADGNRAGLFVDDILGQQQVVIKSLETHYRRIEGIAAATILGDGRVALILDAGGLIRLAHARPANLGSGHADVVAATPLH